MLTIIVFYHQVDFWDNIPQSKKKKYKKGKEKIENGESADYEEFTKKHLNETRN